MPVGRGWRGLALCQAVDLVIHHDGRNINVAQRSMHEMTNTDAKEVAIAAECYDVEVGASHFQPLGERQRTSMNSVETKGFHEMWKTAGAANARHHHCFVGCHLVPFCSCAINGLLNGTFSRAPANDADVGILVSVALGTREFTGSGVELAETFLHHGSMVFWLVVRMTMLVVFESGSNVGQRAWSRRC